MKTTHLTNLADERLEPFRALRGRAGRRCEDVVVESYFVVERLLDSAWPVTSVLATPSQLERLVSCPTRRAKLEHTEVLVADGPLLESVVGFDMHRGCLARAPRPTTDPGALDRVGETNERVIVLAERVTDPANVGALVRNAAAFGVHTIVLDPGCGDPFSRKALRAAAGLTFGMKVLEAEIAAVLEALGRRPAPQWARIAAVLDTKATPLTRLTPTTPVALVVGNEGHGLTSDALARIDELVTIPMAEGVDSLNVAAATAVLLYALTQAPPAR